MTITKKDIQDEDIQIGKHFVSVLLRVSENRNLVPHFANRGRPRPRTPVVEENILYVVSETTGISTWRVPIQVGVAHSTVWRVLREQLYLYQL
jgi:hypothetical protein